jgi:hypothetical protein
MLSLQEESGDLLPPSYRDRGLPRPDQAQVRSTGPRAAYFGYCMTLMLQEVLNYTSAWPFVDRESC